MSNYATIKKYNIANGPGIRTAIFFTGCDFHCKGCFNQELWNPNYGIPYTNDTYEEIKNTMNEHIAGLSILGGEPLSEYNLQTVLSLCQNFKRDFPNKTIWLWTGYCYENLVPAQKEVLDYVDTLVDGQFDINKKDLNLQFRGSSNQRIIDLNKKL